MYNIKTGEQTTNSTYLVSVGGRRLAEGKGHETDGPKYGTSESAAISASYQGLFMFGVSILSLMKVFYIVYSRNGMNL